MARTKIHSIEAGIIPIADGCDMAKGRARISNLQRALYLLWSDTYR
jgi:metal-dependent HD superfamily phosphatase/phosphodiesterase